MATKVCFKCGQEKALKEFYNHPEMADGHLGKCKECTKNDTRRNYYKNIEHYAIYDKLRNQTKHRKLARKKYKNNRNEIKRFVSNKTSNAIRDGRLIKQPCETCGSSESVEAHHDNYQKPLDVRWLCFRCHRIYAHSQVVRDIR